MVLSQTEGSVQNYGYCADLDSCNKQLHNPDKKGREVFIPCGENIFWVLNCQSLHNSRRIVGHIHGESITFGVPEHPEKKQATALAG